MEATTVFSSTGSVLAILFSMVAVALFLQKFKLFKNIGPALTVIVLGIILSNTKIMPSWNDSYGFIMTYGVPVSMTIMLMSVDIKALLKLSKQPLLAMLIAVFSVSFVAVIFGLLFADKIDEGWKIAGMFVGTYTGGSANLTAIATGLDVAPQNLAAANAADYVIGMPTLMLMFAAPALIKSSKAFQKFWPYSVSEEELSAGDHKELMAADEWSIKDIATLLALGFVVTEIATILSSFAPANFASAARILLVTTISLCIAQTPFAKKLKGNLNLGLYVALLFLAIIGISVDLKGFFGSTLSISLYCFCIIIGSIVLHLTLTRLCKIKYQYVILSITGAIADGPTAALVAGSADWKSLMSIGLIMGSIGGILGNYVGITVAYTIKAILGL